MTKQDWNANSGVAGCSGVNATSSLVAAGTGVVLAAELMGAPVARVGYWYESTGAFSFVLPLGPAGGSLGVTMFDCAPGATTEICMLGVCGALSDGTGGSARFLTIDTAGRLKLASSGDECCAMGLSSPVGGLIWARMISPFILP